MTPLRLAVALAVVVLLTALVPLDALQDAATAADVDFAARTQPWGWLLFAPLFGVWDSLSLLTLSQHYAVLVTLVALYVSWRVRVARSVDPDAARRTFGAVLRAEAGRGVLAIAGLLAFYAAGMLLPRPMTGIAVLDDELVAVDFHSHTKWSHDGWSLFTSPRNRAWHEAGGFHAAYVTDHYTWRGFDEAATRNPATAGQGMLLLEGAEIRIHRRPTNVLGSRERYLFALDEDSVFMSPDSIAARYDPESEEPPPTLFYTMPGRLIRVVPFSREVPSGMIGIEINDGSPRGLEQVKTERAEILALADSMDLALIGASNLHGWGRTVASWSLLRIPEWRSLSATALGRRIEELLHEHRRNAVTVVERRMPFHGGSPVRVALTLPSVGIAHARMMSWPERASWLAWLLLGGVVIARRARRASQVETALRG